VGSGVVGRSVEEELEQALEVIGRIEAHGNLASRVAAGCDPYIGLQMTTEELGEAPEFRSVAGS
jgi:hypothetical protein